MIDEPVWQGDDREWKDGLGDWQPEGEEKSTEHGRAVATAVFYYAADFNTLYRAPVRAQLEAWGAVYDTVPWLTVELAQTAVAAHFKQSVDGHMLPADVIREAKKINGRA